jgi:hypothetical protein
VEGSNSGVINITKVLRTSGTYRTKEAACSSSNSSVLYTSKARLELKRKNSIVEEMAMRSRIILGSAMAVAQSEDVEFHRQNLIEPHTS